MSHSKAPKQQDKDTEREGQQRGNKDKSRQKGLSKQKVFKREKRAYLLQQPLEHAIYTEFLFIIMSVISLCFLLNNW